MMHDATPPRLATLLLAAALLSFLSAESSIADKPGEADANAAAGGEAERQADVDPKTRATGDLKMLPGFRAELVYKVPREAQGSWVSLTVDPKGRLIASSQGGRMYRLTPPPHGSDQPAQVEEIDLRIGQAQGLLCAFDSLYVVLNGSGAEGSGLYRVRDTDGDDQYDEVKLLRRLHGQGEHGPHGIVLSPDGKSLYIAAGNYTKIPNPERSLVPRHYDEDLILPRQGDSRGHARGLMAPGGWVCRTDPEGKKWELVCSGFRNEYDIAFNAAGELFTYDSDMEWDIGTPWYRPTRVCHVVSGGEFGWRSGTGKWPAHQADSLPAAVEIGPGSPTGVVFGTGAKFPAKYQRAFYICDWSFGNLYAVHLEPNGASYTGSFESFISAAPFPITDVIVNPQDGLLYFTVGGRGVESALYRVWYEGDESTAPAVARDDAGTLLRGLRHQLEALHARTDAAALDEAWQHLGHEDRFIRFAARIAVEHQPVERWRERALALKEPLPLTTAMIALARSVGDQGDAALQEKMLAALDALDWSQLSQRDRLGLLRAYQLTLIRLGRPDEDRLAKLAARITGMFPADNFALNRELCALSVYLQAPDTATKTLALLRSAQTQHEQIFYVLTLRLLKSGWTRDQRREYFEWFRRARQYHGGQSFAGNTEQIRKEAISYLTDEEKSELGDLVADQPGDEGESAFPPREVVRQWTVDELTAAVEANHGPRDFARGQQLFAEASCFKCHRLAGRGGTIGPDLTGAGRRFTERYLIEAMIEPSKVISDQYRSTTFIMADGRVISGHIADMGGAAWSVMTDMLRPGDYTSVKRADVEEMMPSPTSMMPGGLLDTFTSDEIVDLLAYLRSGGDAEHELFQEKTAAR
ncbi:MAG: heme-binding protein [Planctomycetota bacterium]|nr:MAG: heme-binding protein [Planctomycetota bacterium]REJ93234.1 MAG: heme-binding protein [Planctomycetota bacterium]